MAEEATIENDLGPEIGIINNQPEESVEAPDLGGDIQVTPETSETSIEGGKEATIKIDSFDKFDEIRRETKPKESKTLPEKKEIKVEKKAEDKAEEEVIENEDPKPKLEIGKPEKKARDYSGLTEAEVPLFKRMSDEAFSNLKPILLEYKQLKAEAAKPKEKVDNGLPDSYYEHPEAFVLSPDFKQLSGIVNEAEIIRDHWKRQEINIKRTGKFQGLVRNATSGNLEVTEAKDADEQDELNVSKYVDAAREQYIKNANKLEQLTSGFKDKHNKDIQQIKSWEEQFFPGYDDEKHPTKGLQKQIIEALPKPFQGNPITKLLAKVGSANALLMNENKRLIAENAALKGIKTDANKAAPTKDKFTPANKEAKVKGITSFSDFDKLKRGELV